MIETIQNILVKYASKIFIAGRDLIIVTVNISQRKPNPRDIMKIGVANFFIALLLDWLLFYSRREIILSSKDLYIERPGGLGVLLFWYFIIAVGLIVFYFLVSWTYNKVKTKSKQIEAICLGILIIFCPIVISLNYLIPVAKVDNITPIAGRVPDPDSSYSYLFVRPFGLGRCWLQSPVPLYPDAYGKWRTLAHFSGLPGSGYEIVLVNSKTELDKFIHPGGFDCNDIPRHVKRFVRAVYHK